MQHKLPGFVCAVVVVVRVTQSRPTLATPWTAAHKVPLSIGFSRLACVKIPILLQRVALHCMCVQRLSYLSICGWTLGRFLILAAVNSVTTNTSVRVSLWGSGCSSLERISRSGVAGSYGSSGLTFQELLSSLPWWLCSVTFPAAVNQASNLSALSPRSLFSVLFDSGHRNRYEVVSYCDLDWHLSDD